MWTFKAYKLHLPAVIEHMDSQSQPVQTPVLQRKERSFLHLGNPTSLSQQIQVRLD